MPFSFRPARHLALAAGVLSFASLLVACNKGGNADFAKTKSGVEYKIYKNVGGKYQLRADVPAEGDPTYKNRTSKFLTAFISYRTGKDSVLQDTRKLFGSAVPMPLQEVKRKGTPEEAFALLQPGDSAVFRFNADSLYKAPKGIPSQPVPTVLKRGGNQLLIYIKTDKLLDQPAAMAMQQALQQQMMAKQQREMMAYADTQNKKDEAVFQEYLQKNNLKATKTASGIYYVITQPGSGAKAQAGQTVSVQYKGSLLSGKEFDSSAKHGGQPISFPLGRGQVIPGWDEAITLLNKGSKATFLVPSSLAYGEKGSGADIPANSPLRFDVELVDVK